MFFTFLRYEPPHSLLKPAAQLGPDMFKWLDNERVQDSVRQVEQELKNCHVDYSIENVGHGSRRAPHFGFGQPPAAVSNLAVAGAQMMDYLDRQIFWGLSWPACCLSPSAKQSRLGDLASHDVRVEVGSGAAVLVVPTLQQARPSP